MRRPQRGAPMFTRWARKRRGREQLVSPYLHPTHCDTLSGRGVASCGQRPCPRKAPRRHAPSTGRRWAPTTRCAERSASSLPARPGRGMCQYQAERAGRAASATRHGGLRVGRAPAGCGAEGARPAQGDCQTETFLKRGACRKVGYPPPRRHARCALCPSGGQPSHTGKCCEAERAPCRRSPFPNASTS